MKKNNLKTWIIFHLTIVVFFTSCQGQIKTPPNTVIQSTENPKLIKTQGSSTSDNIRCSLQDKAGNLWFGSTGEGVYRFDGKTFTQFTVKDGLNNNTVWAMLEDRSGNIWIGTLDGICRYDGNKFSRVPITADLFPSTNGSNYSSQQNTKNSVWSILQDKSGKIWFGTAEGVYCYNGHSFTHFLQNDGVENKQNLHLKMIDDMLEDKNGNIWFASGMPPGGEGVCRFDGKSIIGFKPNGDGWVRYIKEDAKGNLWFGGRNHGNFIYDGQNFSIFTEKMNIGNPIFVDKKGNIWFNGEERRSSIESVEGIWCYDGKTFKNFGIYDGMSKYFVWNMFEDREGNFWIGTRNTGLYKFDGKTFSSFSE
jgi:ligand-binding sensor domain-containing protein